MPLPMPSSTENVACNSLQVIVSTDQGDYQPDSEQWDSKQWDTAIRADGLAV